jgi:hypothetical protein
MSDGCRAQSRDSQDRAKPCRPRSDNRGCNGSGPVDGVEAAVSDYIERFRAPAADEQEYFNWVPRSDEEAVSRAALALLPSGKRHPHQYRITRVALEESRCRLLDCLPVLQQVTIFDDLHEDVNALIGPIPGIGELTVYDTALRIGAHFGLEPTRVYLHAGTRKGAEALGLDPRRKTIEMDELPEPMRRLSAREAEDVLCMYKSDFG